MREELRVDLLIQDIALVDCLGEDGTEKTAQHVRNVNAIEIVSATVQSSGMRLYEKSYH